MTRAIYRLPPSANLPPFTGATEWINVPPLTPEQLRGKVVLINFWTYTCINWLRTLPYIRTLAKKYQNQGLAVLGVHTPEFSFEHDIDNVRQAIERLGVDYPVVVDNSYAIWNAFANHYWPALYFADIDGRIRYYQFGEGEYEMAERVIQLLLTEAGFDNVSNDLVMPEPKDAEVAADWQNLQSPETYLGYERTANFAGDMVIGGRQTYEFDSPLHLNQWALSGDWTVGHSAVTSHADGAEIAFRFHARDLNLVMGPETKGVSIPFRIKLDGRPPGDAAGADVSADGSGTLTEQRLYQLVRQPGPIASRQFEIEFLSPGAEASAFTFG